MSKHFSEDAVASLLVKRGYQILAQNLLLPTGEVDIVALRHTELVFVEVKYRTGFDPAETISKKKLDRLVSSALLYTAGQRSFRIDVFACTPQGCTWYKGVSQGGNCQGMEWVDLW
ncbi:YraN family protein [Coprothermobacteraceae bacterium]|nr:YraN family protein [Coprothermobacteraceae bacterium]